MDSFIEARLELINYIPTELKVGMFFTNTLYNADKERYFELWQLADVPADEYDEMEFFLINGYPVLLEIFLEDEMFPFVLSDQIGWFDKGEYCDEYSDISLEELNTILRECDGWLEVAIDELDEEEFPLLFTFDGKCIIRYLTDDE
jgi:hypothetical protein